MSMFKSPDDGAVPAKQTALPRCITSLRQVLNNRGGRCASMYVHPCSNEWLMSGCRSILLGRYKLK